MRQKLLVSAVVLAGISAPAMAQSRCKVMDPTGTPLNIRGAPNGEIIGKATNGAMVSILDRMSDSRGRAWVYVAHAGSGTPLGWVFREFVACY